MAKEPKAGTTTDDKSGLPATKPDGNDGTPQDGVNAEDVNPVEQPETPPKPKQSPIVSPPRKSARKIHLKEFIAGQNFNRTFLAGFKMFLNGAEYKTEAEWDETLKQYQNRK